MVKMAGDDDRYAEKNEGLLVLMSRILKEHWSVGFLHAHRVHHASPEEIEELRVELERMDVAMWRNDASSVLDCLTEYMLLVDEGVDPEDITFGVTHEFEEEKRGN